MSHRQFPWSRRGKIRGNESSGKRGTWAGSDEKRRHASFHFERRQKKREADWKWMRQDKLRAAAREILVEEYGGPLPVAAHLPVDHQALSPGDMESILTSKDQRELMKDMELVAKAAEEQWALGTAFKQLCVARLKQILANSNVRPELHMKAVEVGAKLDNINIKWHALANPQKHEHVHVELEQPSVEQLRADLLRFVNSQRQSGAVEGISGNGGADDPKLIEVRTEPA